jgi:uncharacterized membrane protein
VPITVTNAFDYTLGSTSGDTPVAVDVDFGALLVQAGWTNRTVGTSVGLRGFTLDVDSLRVVEYGPGFAPGPINGSRTQPLPAVFYEAPFTSARHSDFDPARNPAGTVLFLMPGTLAPNQRRFFYLYADPLEYGKTPPPQFALRDRAPLDAFLWGSTGTTAYGYEPLQDETSHLVHVLLLTNQKTHVLASQYSGGQFIPVPASAAYPNPVDVLPGGFGSSRAVDFFIGAGTPYKIAADHPIAVFSTGNLTYSNVALSPSNLKGGIQDSASFVPAWNGSFAGRDFWVYGYRSASSNSNPDTKHGEVSVFKATPTGSVTVTATTLSGGPIPDTATNYAVQLSVSQAAATLAILPPCGAADATQTCGWTHVHAEGGDVLVSTSPLGAPDQIPFLTSPVPALTGGPEGNDFFAQVPQDGGWLRVCPSGDPVSMRMIATSHPASGIVPDGPVTTTPPLTVDGSTGCWVYNASTATPNDLLEIYTVTPPGAPASALPGDLALLQGADARPQPIETRGMIGAFAGQGAVDYWTQGDVGVFGYYNATRVAVAVQKSQQNQLSMVNVSPFAVSEDGFQVVQPSKYADATGLVHLVSDKPIGVVSLAPPVPPFQYSQFVAARPPQPQVLLGAAEYRGPLVDLSSVDKSGRQDFQSTGPGTPVTFHLQVANLGRWQAGQDLPDTIHVACTGPQGWAVKGCAQDVTLHSGVASLLDVTITPPSDAVNVNGTFDVTATSSLAPGVVSTFKLIVFVEIRYGVGMWFDVEGGRKTIDPPIGVDPGKSYTYDIVIKNTGSAADRFDLSVEDPRPGWSQQLLLEGDPVTTVALGAGESTTLNFVVTAPNLETAQQNLVRIDAVSEANALAADGVNTATRIRPKIDIALTLDPTTRLAAPNETAVFNLTVNNSGNDIFRIAFNQSGLLPTGWNASLGLDEIDLGPGQPYTFPLYVTPPPGALAGDLATVKVTAETDAGTGGQTVPGDQVSAVVVVRAVHNMTLPPLNDAVADPGVPFTFTLPLTNHGNGQDVVEVVPGASDPAWPVVATQPSLPIGVGATEDFPIVVTVPNGTAPGSYNLTFTLRLTREAFENLTITVDVNVDARIAYEGLLPALALTPGRAKELAVTAVNVGNVAGTFVFNATLPAGWNASFSPPEATLAPGDSIPVTLLVNASRDAPDGAYSTSLDAELNGTAAGDQGVPIAIARPALYLGAVTASGSTTPGDLVLVTATVGNRGSIAAENVSVELLVDGASVDQVVLGRVGVNATQLATLNWLSTHRTSDLKVVLDRNGDIVEASRANHEAQVTFASRVPAPGLPAVLAVAVLASAALRLRSRGKAREREEDR